MTTTTTTPPSSDFLSTADAGRLQPGQQTAGMASGGETAQDAGVTQSVMALFKRSSHPTAAVFHVLFKTAAIILYLLANAISNSFVMHFVVVVILMAFDFWTVKNITGRLMVGLRWWNDLADDGTSTWRYESIDDPSAVSRADYVIFWYSMYMTAFLWSLFAFLNLLKLNIQYLLICIVCLVLTSSNIYGYLQCSKDASQRLRQGVQNAFTQGAVSMFATTTNWLGGMTNRSAAAPAVTSAQAVIGGSLV